VPACLALLIPFLFICCSDRRGHWTEAEMKRVEEEEELRKHGKEHGKESGKKLRTTVLRGVSASSVRPFPGKPSVGLALLLDHGS
jgi:hypothetical protein